MKLVLIIYIVFLFVSNEDLFMEILIVLLVGLFAGNNIPLTQLHQQCLKGDQAACDMDKKINPYVSK